ncbi:acetate kinase [soil metagenome]
MNVFVVNAGSSTVKYQVVDPASGEVAASGLRERVSDYAEALTAILGEIADIEIHAVGHRVVHGGERFTEATLIDDAVEQAIDDLSVLAPLHNPAGLAGIRAARAALPNVPQVAVFDTAFHAQMPAAASTYAIDAALAREHGIRRYGFHGTSYRFVSRAAAELLGRPLEDLKLIVLHLGNGASAAAIAGGRSVDTSMGMTPLEGLVMGTRSGDLDPAILLQLARVAGLSIDDLDTLLNKRSGLLGLSGYADMREVQEAADAGGADAQLALDVYLHRLRHYIGAYAAALGGIDALVFTAGVGENSAVVRAGAVEGIGFLGLAVDPDANAARSHDARMISAVGHGIPVLVVPTNEELEIARQTAALV